MIIEPTLYELKSSGAAWRATLAGTMKLLGYRPTKSDLDVYLKEHPNQVVKININRCWCM